MSCRLGFILGKLKFVSFNNVCRCREHKLRMSLLLALESDYSFYEHNAVNNSSSKSIATIDDNVSSHGEQSLHINTKNRNRKHVLFHLRHDRIG